MALAMPRGLAEQQQMLAMVEAGIRKMHIGVASDIYGRIISGEYLMRCATASHQARSEADPYGVRDEEEVEAELPKKVPVMVDVNSAAQASIHAANCLLFHLGMIDQEGSPIMGSDDPAARKESPILTS